MDKNEALEILAQILEAYREKPYDTLITMIDGEPVTMEKTGRSLCSALSWIIPHSDPRPGALRCGELRRSCTTRVCLA